MQPADSATATDLFDDATRSAAAASATPHRPLADRMQPQTLDEVVGQAHLLGADKPLGAVITGGACHSLVLWGPPGTGKTTLARLIARHAAAHFLSVSAVLSSVKDIRETVSVAKARHRQAGQHSIMFVDEVHRFNKSQQDAFLPHVEDGTITFIGATTENPSFELNNALLSRAPVYVLKPLTPEALQALLQRAVDDVERGLGALSLTVSDAALALLADAADGDARRALGLLEVAAGLAPLRDGRPWLDRAAVATVLSQGGVRRFDKGGEAFYDQISALHKSVRGSDPDAALYWLTRMLDGGCDPHYLLRRIVRIASEDIGNADPRALALANDAGEAFDRLGSPEGDLALAQADVYLACAPKSDAVYKAFGEASAWVRRNGSAEVPLRLRNAPTGLMKRLDYGKGYRHAHNEPDGYAAGEHYFPDELAHQYWYQPVNRGLEIRIGERLKQLRALDAAAHARQQRD